MTQFHILNKFRNKIKTNFLPEMKYRQFSPEVEQNLNGILLTVVTDVAQNILVRYAHNPNLNSVCVLAGLPTSL